MSVEDKTKQWLLEVRTTSSEILSNIDPDDRITIAEAAIKESLIFPHTPHIPWTVVHTEKGIDQACKDLLATIKAPDGTKPTTLNSHRPQIDSLKRLFLYTEDEKPVSKTLGWDAPDMAIFTILDTASNIRDYQIYQDSARIDINQTKSWNKALIEQFGILDFTGALLNQRELFSILSLTDLLRESYLKQSDAGLYPLLKSYQKDAYTLRGIPYLTPTIR